MPFRAPSSQSFAKYFRGWNRLEGRSRADDFAPGLAAAACGPLWFLARQLQIGELAAENAGTPIHVVTETETASLDELAMGSGMGTTTALGAVPVEVLVECEKVEWDWRLRVRAGQHFERLARANGVSQSVVHALRTTTCRIDRPVRGTDAWKAMDLATRRFVSVVAGRVVDGKLLLEKIDAVDPAVSGIDSVGPLMQQWFRDLYQQASTPMSAAWKSERLEYEFQVQSSSSALPGPLKARSYRNGALDWDAFTSTKASTAPLSPPLKRSLTPTHARYAGQPNLRWWEFENRAVNFGAMDIAKTDLCRLILAQFALTGAGDDAFVVPIGPVPVGSLVRVRAVRVEDCFQHLTICGPARNTEGGPLLRWEVFALSPEMPGDPTADFLFVPPVSGKREESPVIEAVQFSKDEDANLCFAIETLIPNQLGEPVAGLSAHLEALERYRVPGSATTAETASASDASLATEAEAEMEGGSAAGSDDAKQPDPTPSSLKYVLATQVPENWIPFVADDSRDAWGLPYKSVRLHRAEVVSTIDADMRASIHAMSRLLKDGSGANVEWVNEEAVGRAGVRVELRRQRIRTATGETFVWLGRTVGVGKGEARSGLRFDSVGSTQEVRA